MLVQRTKPEPFCRLLLIGAALFGASILVSAQSPADYTVQVSAAVQTNPAKITLSWASDPNATAYVIYRKGRDDTSWGTGTSLASTATEYVDTNVICGQAYEYGIFKAATGYSGQGYIYAGIAAPFVEYRGKVLLLVDNTYSASLAPELSRLQQDLIGDGWTVLRHDVMRMAVDPADTSAAVWRARSNELAAVKSLIVADYLTDPLNVKAVFLLGHVPVPYSGNLAPDGHADHVGAWPADVFYADMDGLWTDSAVNSAGASDARNRNVPGDGKWDQTEPLADLKLQVGRVDFANLPAFPQGEGELLRQYLNKDHNFRHKLFTVERRGLIVDNLGLDGIQAYAVNGWRNYAPFFGAAKSFAASDWFGSLTSQSYLWAFGCGGGTYTSAAGVGNTWQYATSDIRAVFTMVFGSYFGDWDSPNNFLRAQLGSASYTLASVWAGRPRWMFHHMALGETIGFSTRITQNNIKLYSGNVFTHQVHVALMGDPTLRMHPVAPPSALAATINGSGGVDLTWSPSPEPVLGYHVYRAPTATGPFTRLTTNLVTGTSFTDPAGSSSAYMVRAIQLEVSSSGSYYNASQGIFQDLTTQLASTSGQLSSSANPSLPNQPVVLTLTLSAVPPGQGLPTGTVQFKIDGTNASGPVALNGGTATYTVSALEHGRHSVTAEYAGDDYFTGTTSVLSPSQVFNTPPMAGPVTMCREPSNGTKLPIPLVLSQDTDADGDPLHLVEVSATSTHGGTIQRDGGWIYYWPTAGFTNADSFTYTIGDDYSTTATGLVSVVIPAESGPSQNLAITPLNGSQYLIRGDGIPGRSYQLEYAEAAQPTTWQPVGVATADPYGSFQLIDSNGSPQRIYRWRTPPL